jgi:hypothetical protein
LARIGIVTWDGGGNVDVALGIAVALAGRGHMVTAVGPRSLRDVIEDAGVGYAELGVLAPREPALRSEYLLEVAGASHLTDELRRLLDVLRVEAAVVDCNLAWALQAGIEACTAVLVHTAIGLYLPLWQAVLDTANRQRAVRGLTALTPAAEAWASADRLLVASIAQFDTPVPSARLRPCYVGPVAGPRGPTRGAASVTLPAGRPLVLISYSTDRLQNGPRRVQVALDGLADLPVVVLASSSGLFRVTQLSVPANAAVVDYLPLGSVMSQAAVAVCHAGHGTTMTALSHGVPVVAVPGLGRDQRPIAARVADLGLGIAVADDATSGEIRDAVSAILGDGGYRRRARSFARQHAHTDAALEAALEVEAMIG